MQRDSYRVRGTAATVRSGSRFPSFTLDYLSIVVLVRFAYNRQVCGDVGEAKAGNLRF